MSWTWKLGKVAGIRIQVHATFLLLVAWVAWVYWQLDPSIGSVRDGVLFLLVVFGIVVLHELSHSFAARLFGIGTTDITLLPIGGVSRLERQPERPHQELVVALAGPALNLLLAAVCVGILLARSPDLPGAANHALAGESFVADLLWVNVALAVFNLLPAFPMDGGRAVRALLAMVTDRTRATRIAAGLGKALALAFVVVGVLWNPVLAIIGVFVWLGATAEGATAEAAHAMEGLTVRDAMITAFHGVGPRDPLADPVHLLLSSFQQDFPVVDQGRLVGMLPLEALLQGLGTHGHAAPVGAVMLTDVQTARPEEDLNAVTRRLGRRERRCLPVVVDGVLQGVLTIDNIAELLRVHAALEASRGQARRSSRTLLSSDDEPPRPRALTGGPRHG
jgi:Zn-dependent protease/CBS domain-containing protein